MSVEIKRSSLDRREINHAHLVSRNEKLLQEDRAVLEAKFVEETASFVAWMAHPYVVSFVAVFFGFQMLLVEPSDSALSNVWRGAGFATVVYLIVCSWQLRDSLLVRPHPVFWRLVKGLALLYAVGLVFLVFQKVDDVRHMLSYWDPSLGVPLVERSYATECAVYTPNDPVSNFRNIYDALFDGEGFFDVFIICHVLGWFCKMLMIRDLRLTIVASFLFEIYELSFMHMLPNFRECWWDSLILDIVVCNGLGIVCGYYWLKFWKCADYNFLGDVDVMSGGRVVRRWKPLVSFKYFVAPLVVLVSLAAIELNAFFLKFILWVPPPHHLNLARVVFWWLLGCAGTRELYFKVQTDGPLGMMIALIFVNAALELLICFRMGAGMFPVAAPAYVKWPWFAALTGLVLFALIYYPMRSTKDEEIVTDAEGAASKKTK